MSITTQKEQAQLIARRNGILSASEARRSGIHSQILFRLVAEGVLERVGPGRYRLTDAPISEHHSLILAATAIPNGIICLFSALNFHNIGTTVPSSVWIALDRRARIPTVPWPPLRVVRFGGTSLTAGVEIHTLEGTPVHVYGVAKTIADLFKYRNKIGLDVALEALKEVWSNGRVQMDELMDFARICRVERVIRPYLEAVAS